MEFAIHEDGGREGTVAEAIDFFQRDATVGAGIADAQTQGALKTGDEVLAAHALTCFGAADLDDMPSRGLPAEVMVKRDDAMHFGPAEIQHFGDQLHRTVADETGMLVHGMQDRQQWTFEILVLFNDAPDP